MDLVPFLQATAVCLLAVTSFLLSFCIVEWLEVRAPMPPQKASFLGSAVLKLLGHGSQSTVGCHVSHCSPATATWPWQPSQLKQSLQSHHGAVGGFQDVPSGQSAPRLTHP